jgi:hypothetical protein
VKDLKTLQALPVGALRLRLSRGVSMKPSRETIRRALILLALVLLAYLLLLNPRSRRPEPSFPPNPGTGEDGSSSRERRP